MGDLTGIQLNHTYTSEEVKMLPYYSHIDIYESKEQTEKGVLYIQNKDSINKDSTIQSIINGNLKKVSSDELESILINTVY